MKVSTYHQVKEKVHFTPAHIRRLIKLGEFPKPIKLGTRRVVFADEEIDAWLEAKANDRKAEG